MKKIKQLQNNFTTPEQSKRLLELGVPADSADCYYVTRNNYTAILHNELFTECRDEMIKVSKTAYRVKMHDDDVRPCWSVGRLMEITFECDKRKVNITYRDIVPCKGTIIERIINILEYAIECNDIDFSKLEE